MDSEQRQRIKDLLLVLKTICCENIFITKFESESLTFLTLKFTQGEESDIRYRHTYCTIQFVSRSHVRFVTTFSLYAAKGSSHELRQRKTQSCLAYICLHIRYLSNQLKVCFMYLLYYYFGTECFLIHNLLLVNAF